MVFLPAVPAEHTMQLPEECMVQKGFLYSIIKEKDIFSNSIYLLECNTIFMQVKYFM
jgi:hypothetical protein